MSKLDSFDNWIRESKPGIFTMQETKVTIMGQIQSQSTNKYQLYEKIQEVNPGLGGGLCIGVNKNLHSSLLREGEEEVECLTVQVQVGQQEMVVVCGYGPQVYASPARKEKFWEYLGREVQEASREDKMLVIQMDSNCWLGGNIIPGDPNKIANSNGKLFQGFLQRNNDMHLVNSMSICNGVITRQRITDTLNEKSVIDVFLVCGKVLPYVQKVLVDEKRENPLTNFSALNRCQKITESDNNKLELCLNMETPQIKPQREGLFNFKSVIGQKTFFEVTNNSEKLRNCFKTNHDFLKQAP